MQAVQDCCPESACPVQTCAVHHWVWDSFVQDGAMVREELGELVQSLRAADQESIPEAQAPAAEAAEAAVCPLETLESGDKQVRTLAQILKTSRTSA